MAYIGKTPVIGNFVKLDSITVVNGQAAYTMQNGGVNFTSYDNVNQFLVSLNGVLQAPTDSFTVSGSTLTFASNLSTGDVIDFVLVLGNSLDIGTPSDNTVSLAKLTATGTKDATTFLRGDNTFAEAGGKFESALLHVRDEKSAGTNGGTFTSGSFQTRDLNTSVTNEISGASLSSNQITLPSGTYFITASAPFHDSGRSKAKLRNVSDSSDTIIGTTDFGSSADDQQGTNFITGRFTISSSKTFEIQQRCESSKTTTGFGVASNFSVVEVYTDVQIWKVA